VGEPYNFLGQECHLMVLFCSIYIYTDMMMIQC